MYNEPPQWPDRPPQTPVGRPPQSRNRLLLGLVAIVAAVLIVALVGTLFVILARGAQGSTTVGEQGAAAATAAAAGASTNGQPTPISGDATTSTGGNSATPTPTNTPPSAEPTSTTFIVCCLSILPSVHEVVHQVTLSGTDVGPVTASCPSGEIALSGGWATTNRSDLFVYNSSRSGTGGWQVYVSHSSPLLANAYVECLRNAAGATIVQRLTQVPVAPGDINSATAACNAGEVLVGAGYALNNGLELYNFAPASATQWRGYARNHGTMTGLLNIYVQCLTYGSAHNSTATVNFSSIAAGATGSTVSGACPSGSVVSGGGFADSEGAFIYTMSASGNGTTWTVYLYADGGRTEQLNSYAMCLAF